MSKAVKYTTLADLGPPGVKIRGAPVEKTTYAEIVKPAADVPALAELSKDAPAIQIVTAVVRRAANATATKTSPEFIHKDYEIVLKERQQELSKSWLELPSAPLRYAELPRQAVQRVASQCCRVEASEVKVRSISFHGDPARNDGMHTCSVLHLATVPSNALLTMPHAKFLNLDFILENIETLELAFDAREMLLNVIGFLKQRVLLGQADGLFFKATSRIDTIVENPLFESSLKFAGDELLAGFNNPYFGTKQHTKGESEKRFRQPRSSDFKLEGAPASEASTDKSFVHHDDDED